ncbi:hypothetical protein ACJX0J_039653, partial [Zea mays]
RAPPGRDGATSPNGPQSLGTPRRRDGVWVEVVYLDLLLLTISAQKSKWALKHFTTLMNIYGGNVDTWNRNTSPIVNPCPLNPESVHFIMHFLLRMITFTQNTPTKVTTYLRDTQQLFQIVLR